MLFFYSADHAEPPHAHVEREECAAKFWLDPVRSEFSREAIVEESEWILVDAWHEYFGN